MTWSIIDWFHYLTTENKFEWHTYFMYDQWISACISSGSRCFPSVQTADNTVSRILQLAFVWLGLIEQHIYVMCAPPPTPKTLLNQVIKFGAISGCFPPNPLEFQPNLWKIIVGLYIQQINFKERKEKKENGIILIPDFLVSQSFHSNVSLSCSSPSAGKAWVVAVCNSQQRAKSGGREISRGAAY